MTERVRAASASVVLLAGATAAVIGTIGADSRWAAALGGAVVERGSLPRGVPYAAAASSGWHDALVLAELLFRGLYAVGADHALLVAQVAAVLAAFAILAVDAARAGAGDGSSALALLLVLAGALPAVAVVRLQLFSLVCFPVLLLLLRAESRRPSRRIWLLPPLLALWANLHGAVLVGLAVAVLHLLLGRARRRPAEALGAAACCLAATSLTPALLDTPAYFASLLGNEAARTGSGMWAPLSLRSPTDVLLLAAAVVLVPLALRRRLPLWELAAAVLLALTTVHASRGGVWLLFLLAAPAAAELRLSPGPRRVTLAAAALAAATMLVGLIEAPLVHGEPALVRRAIAAARGGPILAEPLLAEQVAVDGGRVWLSNPIDAFSHADQRLWLDWADGRPAGDAARSLARVVLVEARSRAARRVAADRRFRLLVRDRDAAVYVRSGAAVSLDRG